MVQVPSASATARREVIGLKQQLDTLYSDYRQAVPVVQLNFQGELHKYMCIRLAGFLEQLFFTAVAGYVRSHGSDEAAAFALRDWKHAPNLGPEALDKLIGRFGSDSWSQSLEQLTSAGNFRGD